MAAPKGHKRYGGRQKGTPNKSTLRIEEILTAENFHVIPEMIALFRNTENDKVKASVVCHLCDLVHAKRKAIEHSGEITNPYLQKSMEELESLVKSKLKEKK